MGPSNMYKIPKLTPPRLYMRLNFSNSAKFLAVILDKKLLWNENSLDNIKK